MYKDRGLNIKLEQHEMFEDAIKVYLPPLEALADYNEVLITTSVIDYHDFKYENIFDELVNVELGEGDRDTKKYSFVESVISISARGFIPGKGFIKSGWNQHIKIENTKEVIRIEWPLGAHFKDERIICVYHNHVNDTWLPVPRCKEPNRRNAVAYCVDHLSRFALVTPVYTSSDTNLEKIKEFENGLAGQCLTLALVLSFIGLLISIILECSTAAKSKKHE
jgi:hypothetical protein